MQASNELQKKDQQLFLLATSVTLIIGIAAILGWFTHNDFLRSINAGGIRIKVNVAICLILASLSLLAHHFFSNKKPLVYLSVVFAFIISSIGLITLFEYLANKNLGIDELFFKDEIPLAVFPGRMSPLAAIYLLFTGIALITLNNKRTALFQLSYLFGMAFISLMMLIGFNFISDIPTFFRLSINASIAFIFLAVAIYYAQPILREKMNFEQKLVMGFFATIILILMMTIFSFYYNNKLIDSYRWVEHTNQVLHETEQTLALTKDIEGSSRGYVLTSDSGYLENFEESKTLIYNHLQELKTLVSDNAVQRPRIDSLKIFVNKRIDFSEQCIRTANEKGFDAAVALINTRQGKIASDKIKDLIADIQQEEKSLLVTRQQENARSAISFNRAFISLMGSVVLLLIIIFFVIRYSFKRQQKAEEQAIASNKTFTSLFNLSPVAITINKYSDRTFLYVNDAFCKLLGFNREEVLGKRSTDLNMVTKEDQEKRVKIIEELGGAKGVEIKVRKSNGELIDVINSFELIEIDNQQCWVSAFVDISAQKEAEEKIKGINAELEKRVTERTKALQKSIKELSDYKYALDESSIIAITDQTGIIKYVNQNFCKISKYSAEELLFKDHRIINSGYHPKEYIRNLWVTIANGKIWRGELKNKAKDGTYYWVDTTIVPFLNETGKPFQYVAIRSDITERKKIEEEIIQLNEDLEERVRQRTLQLQLANEELEAFTYSVSHDLRSPLRIIDGYADILSEDYGSRLDEDGKRILGNIMENARRMGRLIDALLHLSRLGRKDIELHFVDMNNLLKSLLSEQSDNPAFKPDEIIVHHLEPVYCDSSLIKQVWINLISNAVKYSSVNKASRVEIGSEKNGSGVTYYVKDNGVGFDMKYSDKLFGVFQRLHKITEFEGTGVGLAIVFRIINKHNGKVWAEAEPGKGATFYFNLPFNNINNN